ncbi:hypothetical protein Hanom_Chr01g00031181 [Helianthus anomalus]
MVGGGGPLDRKRINDALDKQLEKTSSSSTSRFLNKEKDRIYMSSTSTASGGKSHQSDHQFTTVTSFPRLLSPPTKTISQTVRFYLFVYFEIMYVKLFHVVVFSRLK